MDLLPAKTTCELPSNGMYVNPPSQTFSSYPRLLGTAVQETLNGYILRSKPSSAHFYRVAIKCERPMKTERTISETNETVSSHDTIKKTRTINHNRLSQGAQKGTDYHVRFNTEQVWIKSFTSRSEYV